MQFFTNRRGRNTKSFNVRERIKHLVINLFVRFVNNYKVDFYILKKVYSTLECFNHAKEQFRFRINPFVFSIN